MKNFEEFFVCPNCKSPLYRKEAMRTGDTSSNNYCGICGVKITSAKTAALEELNTEKNAANDQMQYGGINYYMTREDIVKCIKEARKLLEIPDINTLGK